MDATMIPSIVVPALAEHLRSLGYDAEVADDGLGRALWVGREAGSVALRGGPVDLVAVAMPGLSSMRPSNWSHLTTLGRLPLAGRKVWPVEYRYVVKATGLLDRETFKAQWKGAKAAPRWKGGRLASVLAADRTLCDALGAALEGHDRLSVRAVPATARVEVVHETRRLIGFALLPKPRLDLEGGWPTREVLDAVGLIADRARAYL